jgi:mRNA interferase HigB
VELLNAIELDRAARKHAQAKTWLAAWRNVVAAAEWRNLNEVRRVYPAADGVSIGKGKDQVVVTVFNVTGNKYRLLTRINYERQIVQVMEVLSHAEYSKEKWKRRVF